MNEENKNSKLQWQLKYTEQLNEYHNIEGGGMWGGVVPHRSGNVGPIDGGGTGRVNVIQPKYDVTTNSDINKHDKEQEDKEEEEVCEECGEDPCVCEDEDDDDVNKNRDD